MMRLCESFNGSNCLFPAVLAWGIGFMLRLLVCMLTAFAVFGLSLCVAVGSPSRSGQAFGGGLWPYSKHSDMLEPW